MATMPTAREARQLQRRKVIERPRLFALLDESRARVKTLVAPAGYGKTTLAEQWVERDGRRAAWFTVRRAANDVAALALGIARACTVLVPGCDQRLREHLRAVPAPADQFEVLAEILGEDLGAWPDGAWLVLDDYHELVPGSDAEQFVAALVRTSPAQLLIASRQRPSWITTRGILYGEVLELNQTTLAMDSSEAAEVLSDETPETAAGLVALANGWPAVIGLARVSGAEIGGDIEQVPESLYRFFAEEVYAALDDVVRRGLATLSVAPVIDRDVVLALLSPTEAEAVCATALDVGILVEHGAQLELHPLCRSFLEEWSAEVGFVPAADSVERCLEHFRARREWDMAFELIVRRNEMGSLEPLLQDALDELLETARLSTVESWCDAAGDRGREAAIFLLARAETTLRRGRHTEAQAYAEAAAERSPSLSFRALSIAGRAAHLGSREEDGLDLYRRAEETASTEGERRDALWGQLVCAIELELPDTPNTYATLRAGVKRSDPRELVRAAACGLSLGAKTGVLELTEADVVHQLLGAVDDALVTSSFQSSYSVGLALCTRYDEALDVAEALLETATTYRLDFALPYGHYAVALACAGLRQWSRAQSSLDHMVVVARANHDMGATHLAYALQLRVLAQQGHHRAALALEMPSLAAALPAARAEVESARALVLSSAGRVQEARALLKEIRGATSSVEPTVLAAAAAVVCALRARDSHIVEAASSFEAVAFETGGLDLLVTAYRANPDLLSLLLRTAKCRERVGALVRRVGDADLATAVGEPVPKDGDPRARLTPREREVYRLLVQGAKTAEIAEVLFISPGTVKVHTQHIFDKLGLRSRTALAVQAALEGSGSYATSATETDAGS